GGHAEPAALADREASHAVMAPDLVAVDVEDRPRRGADPRLHELHTIATRDEADVHALRLRCRAEPERGGARPHLGLRELTDREPEPSQLVLREAHEHVRLVLRRVGRPYEAHSAVVIGAQSGVVTGRERVEAEEIGALEQATELEVPIARDTGIGCVATRVRAHVRLYD